MKKILLLITLLLMIFPVKVNNAAADVDVELPVDELRQLVQQLDDIANNLTGQLGVEMRRTIDELNDKIEQQIGNIKDASIEIIREASEQLRSIILQLSTEVRKLIREVDQMVRNQLKCLDEILAKRVAQIKDSIIDLIGAASEAVQQAIDRVYLRATQLIDTGTSRVAVLLDKTVENAIRIGLVIGIFVLLFWLIRSLWNLQTAAKLRGLRVVVLSIAVLLVAGMSVLLFSTKALAKVAGKEVIVPKWETSCDDGEGLFNRFVRLQNSGASEKDLKVTGDKALEALNWCIVTSMSPEIARGKKKQIDEISAVLYPPPPVPNNIPTDVTANCGGGGKGPFYLGWFSRNDVLKLSVLSQIEQEKKIKITNIYQKISPTLINTPKAEVQKVYLQDVKMVASNTVDPNLVIKSKGLDFRYKGTVERMRP